MKVRLIAAACALATMGSAHALTPTEVETARGNGTLKEVFISGASALRVSFGAYMQEICTPASFDVFYDDAGVLADGVYRNTVDGINHRAYSCNLAVTVGTYPAGTPVLVYKRDQGGSGQGVTPILQAALLPLPASASIARMNVGTVAPTVCTAVTDINGDAAGATANPSPAEDVQIPTYLCSGTTNAQPHGGISNVEPLLLQQSVNLQTGQSAAAVPASVNAGSLVQGIFAVAVNKKAYRALQEAQGIIAPGAALLDVPADQNSWTNATLATIPSLPLEWVRGAHVGSVIGSAGGRRGWDAVIPTTVDPVVLGKTVNVCRRVEGSGTQATSNVHLMLNPCQVGYGAALTPSGFAQDILTPAAAGTSGTIGVRATSTAYSENTSAGNVETCLGTTVESAVNPLDLADDKAYGLAWLGRELNPLANAGDRGYRYVKLDGQAPTRLKAKAGDYAAVFEATMQWNSASPVLAGTAGTDIVNFMTSLRNNIGKSASLAKLDADTQQGVMAPPATYTGAYAALTNVDEVAFGSRVSRASNNSCTPLRIVK